MTDSAATGLPVLFVAPGSPAEKAGLAVGDKIIIANGVRIDSMESFVAARGKDDTGLSVTVQRGSRVFDAILVFDQDVHP